MQRSSYLSDRWQHVFINGISSDKKQILTGVPQCSIPGPFVFLLYINNLDTSSGDSKVTMFADDTTLINGGLTSAFQYERILMQSLSIRLAANKLTINADKSEMMFFGSGIPKPLKMNDTSLKFKSSCKYLGVHLYKWLQFNQHIDYVVKKLHLSGQIYSCRHLYPRE